jgi:hypothetical protein
MDTPQEIDPKRLRRRIIWVSLFAGIALGIWYYISETRTGVSECAAQGHPFPCRGLQNAFIFAPFTFWLYTVPIGWLLSFPIIAFALRRKRGGSA